MTNTVTFRRIGSRIVGFIRGKMVNKDFDDVEKAKQVDEGLREYKEALQAGRTEEAEEIWAEVELLFNPYARIFHGDYLETDGRGNVYAKGSKIPMPPDLAEFMLKLADEGDDAIKSYVRWWKLACLAPPKARDSLFGYIQNFGVVITDHGYMLLYKAVRTKDRKHPSEDLARFVAEKFVTLAMAGSDPSDFVVYRGDDGFYTANRNASPIIDDHERMGTLGGLMRDLQMRVNRFKDTDEKETTYTDLWSGTMDIRLGVQQYKNPDECQFEGGPCGHGLHFGAPSYVTRYGLSKRVPEDQELVFMLVLVNPKDVIRAFSREDKMGGTRYLPIGIMEKDENGNWEAIEQNYFEFDYIDYEVEELEQKHRELEEELRKARVGNGEELKATFNLQQEQMQIVEQRLVDLKAVKPETRKDLVREEAPDDSKVKQFQAR